MPLIGPVVSNRNRQTYAETTAGTAQGRNIIPRKMFRAGISWFSTLAIAMPTMNLPTMAPPVKTNVTSDALPNAVVEPLKNSA